MHLILLDLMLLLILNTLNIIIITQAQSSFYLPTVTDRPLYLAYVSK